MFLKNLSILYSEISQERNNVGFCVSEFYVCPVCNKKSENDVIKNNLMVLSGDESIR